MALALAGAAAFGVFFICQSDKFIYAGTVGGQVGEFFVLLKVVILLGVEEGVFGGPDFYVGDFTAEGVAVQLRSAGRGAKKQVLTVFAEFRPTVVADAVAFGEPVHIAGR